MSAETDKYRMVTHFLLWGAVVTHTSSSKGDELWASAECWCWNIISLSKWEEDRVWRSEADEYWGVTVFLKNVWETKGTFFFFFANLIISQIGITCQISSRVNTGYKLPQQRKKWKSTYQQFCCLGINIKMKWKNSYFGWFIFPLSMKISPPQKKRSF